jgi:hypothetical protein
MSACLVFVFAALLEYAVVNVIARKQELKKLVKLSERVILLHLHLSLKNVYFELLILKNEKHKHERKMNMSQKAANSAAAAAVGTEKVMAIGNRLANLNIYKKPNDLDGLTNSNEALESLLHHNHNHNHHQNNNQPHHIHSNQNSYKKKLYSTTSLHVDSAVSISGASQQSDSATQSPTLITAPAAPIATVPPAPPPPPSLSAVAALPAVPPRATDDAQMVDFASSFLFPISFIIFNIIYWMVYLNMQVTSGN